jgi:hypothetical protein
MIGLFPTTFTRCAQVPPPLAVPVDFRCVCARLGLALRFCAAVALGLAVVVGAIVVWAVAGLAVAVVGDVPPKRSFCANEP